MQTPMWDSEEMKESREAVMRILDKGKDMKLLCSRRASYNAREQDILREYSDLFEDGIGVRPKLQDIVLFQDEYKGCILAEVGPRECTPNSRTHSVRTIYRTDDHYNNSRVVGYVSGPTAYATGESSSAQKDIEEIWELPINKLVDSGAHKYMVDKTILVDTSDMDRLNEFVDKMVEARAASHLKLDFYNSKFFLALAAVIFIATALLDFGSVVSGNPMSDTVTTLLYRTAPVIALSGIAVDLLFLRRQYNLYKKIERVSFSGGYLEKSDMAGGAIFATNKR